MLKCKYCGYKFTRKSTKTIHENTCPYKNVKIGYKLCKNCGKEYPTSFFNKEMRKYDSINSYCKNCTRQYNTTWKLDFSEV